jgi:hypothetical protein
LRKDSLSLLSKYMGAVAGMLDSPDAPEQRMGVVILSALISRAPTPPAGALPPLIAFLKRTDRDVEAQAGAISALVDAAVDDEAASAIDQFLARDLSPQTRVVSLYGLTSPKLVLHPIVISRMISLLSGGDVMVKTTAIDSLTRIGPQALLLAEPVLVKLSEDAATPDSLRSAAKTALGKIGHRLE